MNTLLILQTTSAKNPGHIIASEELQARYDMTAVDYADITGFDGPVLRTQAAAINLDAVDKIWLEFDWELTDSHVNYHHVTRLIIAKYPEKLVVNRKTFQTYHPDYDDKMFVSNLLHYAGLPHPKTVLLSGDDAFDGNLAVIKKRFSGRARDVYLVRQRHELDEEILTASNDYIRQPYIDIDTELRVVVYRGEVVAAIEKSSKFKNATVGKVKIIDKHCTLDTAQTQLCLDTARAIESDLLGIDLAIDTAGNNWIIEFNIGADLTRFREVTGIDILQDLLLT